MASNRRWSHEEDALLCEHWPRIRYDEALAARLLPDRTMDAIRRRGSDIGMRVSRRIDSEPEEWSADELLALVDQYPRHGFDWEGWRRLLPNRSKRSVMAMASSLGIRHGSKIPKAMEESDSCKLLRMVKAIADSLGVEPRDVANELCRLAYVHETGGDGDA